MATPKTTDAPSAQSDFQKRFPTMAWVLNEPGVMSVLQNQDIQSTDELQAALQQTDWWKQNQASVRAYQQLQQQDPASLAQQLGQKAADVNDLYKSMGLPPSAEDQTALAQQALQLGWTTSQLQDAVIAHISATGLDTHAQGAIQTNMSQLKQAASNYYVSLDDGTAQQWATQISAGEKKLEDFTPTLTSWAQNKFAGSPDVIAALGRGETTDAYFAPYKTHIAQLMNTSADSVNLANNPLYSKILSYNDPKTNQQRVMNYTEMDNYLRSTDEYDRTPDAMSQAASVGAGILKTFGKVA